MKLLVKSSFTISLLLFIVNISFAQKRKKAAYHTVVVTNDSKYHGKITAINQKVLVLVDKKDIAHEISYDNINRIKVFKTHGDVGYAIVTAALVGGTIAAGQAIDDANVALIVGAGGTAAVVGLSMVMHNLIHGAEVKMKASNEKINYNSANQKLSRYVIN